MHVNFVYEPRTWAKELHDSPKKRAILVIHRQGGKTTACLHHLLMGALKTPNARFAYIAPTYKQAKNVAWDSLKTIVRPLGKHAEANEVDLTIRFPNGSRITLYGADNPDSLRGITLHGVVFDEYSQHPSNIYSEIIQYTLSTTGGFAIWIGTPKGKNAFFELYQTAIKNPSEWLAIFRTIEDTISEEKAGGKAGETVEGLRKHLDASRKEVESGVITEDEFRQELYCSFDASVKGAYYSLEIEKARTEGRIKPVPYDPTALVYTVWDLGVSDSTSIGFYQKIDSRVHMIDYYENTGQGLPHYINVLRNKGYTYGTHFAPHDIAQREFTTGRSRQEIARDLGIAFDITPDMSVADGINAGRLVFNRLYLDADKCADFIDKLARYHKEWDDKKGVFKDKPRHDDTSHAADVHRYMAINEPQFSYDYSAYEEVGMYNSNFN